MKPGTSPLPTVSGNSSDVNGDMRPSKTALVQSQTSDNDSVCLECDVKMHSGSSWEAFCEGCTEIERF